MRPGIAPARSGLADTTARSGRSYDELRSSFRWEIPARFNIGVQTVGRHADRRPGATALIFENEAGIVRRYTFWEIRRLANKLANVLVAQGLRPGDRVAILMPQAPRRQSPTSPPTGPGWSRCRSSCCSGPTPWSSGSPTPGAKAIVTDLANWPKVAEIRERLPELRSAIVAGGGGIDGTLDFDAALAKASRRFRWRDVAGRRAGDDQLHLRDDRSAQGRPPRPSLPAWPPAGRDAAARLSAAPRRRVLDAGRLGLDRGPVRRPLPGLVLGPARGRPPGPEVRPGAGVRPHGPPRRDQRVPAADRAEADAAGRRPAAGWVTAAGRRERRRDAWRRAARLGPGQPWADDQRVLRPDRVQPRGLEQRGHHAGEARFDGPAGAGPRGRDHLRGRRGACPPARSARSPSAGPTR